MALQTRIATATVNAQATTLSTLCNSGIIRIYDGTQPATADTAAAGTLGVTLTFNATAFGAPSDGLLTANAISSGVAAAPITPTWARILKSDTTTTIMDVSAGASGCNLTIGAFTAGTTVTCSAFTHDVLNMSSGL